MDDRMIREILSRSDGEGRHKTLSCKEAFAIAGEYGVDTAIIGRICNEQKIRITCCQLGCF